jgi:branched-chain amino acid transport system substrate-binding protein
MVPLELIELDDESDPTKTVQHLETLYSSDDVVAYLGGFGSDLHAAAAAIAEKNKVPYIGVAFALNSVHQQGFKYLFSPFPKSPAISVATFDMLDSLDPKPTNVAIFAEKTDWGAELAGLWTEQANHGYTVTPGYAPAPQTSPRSSSIKTCGCCLSMPAGRSRAGKAAQGTGLQRRGVCLCPCRIRHLARTWWIDGFMLMPGWNRGANVVAEMATLAKFSAPAAATTGPAYAAVQILADAIHRAGSLDRAAIRDAIAATDLDTIVGHVTFKEDGTADVVTIINQWQGGKQALVWPPDQALAEVLYPATPWKDR